MIIEEKRVKLKNGQICTLRSPRLEDAKQLIDYLKVTAGETDFLLKYPEEVVISVEEERDILQKFIELEKELMIIAEIDGKVAGNCAISPVGNKIRTRHRCSMGIALYEKYWGLGIGTALLELLIAKAAEIGYEQIELEVVRSNERAIALYEKVGFVAFAVRPDAMKYKNGVYDDYVMMVRKCFQ